MSASPALKYVDPESQQPSPPQEHGPAFEFFTWQRELIDRNLLAQISGNAAKLLWVIGKHANKRGQAWPSRETLYAKTGMKQTAFSKALRELVAGRLLRRRKKLGVCTVYTLITDFDPGLFAEAQDAGGAGEEPDIKRGDAPEIGTSPKGADAPVQGAHLRPHPGADAPTQGLKNSPERTAKELPSPPTPPRGGERKSARAVRADQNLARLIAASNAIASNATVHHDAQRMEPGPDPDARALADAAGDDDGRADGGLARRADRLLRRARDGLPAPVVPR